MGLEPMTCCTPVTRSVGGLRILRLRRDSEFRARYYYDFLSGTGVRTRTHDLLYPRHT